jgi:BirA family biotin operon repressor/biotin-[acetyl-CoA-carboxylase] ligase
MILHRAPFVIHHFTTLRSPSDTLKSMSDAPAFTVVTADEQTAGRGRRDRSWYSPPGDGLYLSILLRPVAPVLSPSLISLLAAIAVAETIIDLGVREVDIKWPNDVLIDGRKVCGILAEGATSGNQSSCIVVGIGVNLNQHNFPEEIAEVATSLFLSTKETMDAARFRDHLLTNLERWYELWHSGADLRIIERWEELSSYAKHRQVRIETEGEEIVGETVGLAGSGALLVRTPDGQVRAILAGQVSRLR